MWPESLCAGLRSCSHSNQTQQVVTWVGQALSWYESASPRWGQGARPPPGATAARDLGSPVGDAWKGPESRRVAAQHFLKIQAHPRAPQITSPFCKLLAPASGVCVTAGAAERGVPRNSDIQPRALMKFSLQCPAGCPLAWAPGHVANLVMREEGQTKVLEVQSKSLDCPGSSCVGGVGVVTSEVQTAHFSSGGLSGTGEVSSLPPYERDRRQ